MNALTDYARKLRLGDGSRATIRPICPGDEPLMVQFHRELSETSVYHRYFAMLKLEQRIAHSRLERICTIDFHHDTALVLDREHRQTRQHEIIAVARISRLGESNIAEFAIVVTDRWQRQGLGVEMLRSSMEVARSEGIATLRVVVLPDNREMLHLAEKHGFKLTRSVDGEVVGELQLTEAASQNHCPDARFRNNRPE